MPRRSNAQADLSAVLDANPVLDKDNVYFSNIGWCYRHYTNAAKTAYWDEVLVAGEALDDAGAPDATAAQWVAGTGGGLVPPASPTFLVGDGAQMPIDRVYVVELLTGGATYVDATGVATTGGSGTGLTVDIVTDGGVVTDVNLAAQGDGAYADGDVITITGGDGAATFSINVL